MIVKIFVSHAKIARSMIKVIAIRLFIGGIKMDFKNDGMIGNLPKNINKEVLKLSNYEKYGARRIDKIIKNNIEEIIIDGIIDGKNNIKIENLNTILV